MLSIDTNTMVKNKPKVVISQIAIIVLATICISFAWLGNSVDVERLTQEDGVVENLTALFYLCGLLVSMLVIFRKEKLILPIFWAVVCLVLLGEETSWFQRALNYSIPSVEGINTQNEFNLHNINIFQGTVDESPLGGFYYNLLNAQNLFRLFFATYFLIIPLLSNIEKIGVLYSNLGYKKPSNNFIITIFSILSFSFFISIGGELQANEAQAEIREMFYSFTILAYIYTYLHLGSCKATD